MLLSHSVVTITIPPPDKHHCTLLGMHRHYKDLPPSSRCLAVGEYPRVDQVIAKFLRVVDAMRIYTLCSTIYRWEEMAR